MSLGRFHRKLIPSTADQVAAEKLRSALSWSDNFNFDRSGFNDFFAIRFLGHLREGNKPKIWKHRQRFKNGLRALITDPDGTLPKVLEPHGSLKVPGVKLNTISKILALHDPLSWPVFNNRVKDVLVDFGYRAPRGASTTTQYRAYTDLMKKFSVDCGFKHMDAFALDAFFLESWKKSTAALRSKSLRAAA